MSIPRHPSSSSMFHGAHDNTFKDSIFVLNTDRIAAFDRLEKAASPSAFHSFVGRPDPGKCYPNTRVALLEGLEKWSMGAELPENLFEAGLDNDWSTERSDQLRNRPIMWLRGGAGAGKSAVAQTFAERCEDLGHIVASFFFFSTDSTRNQANRLVATLAYQIARAEPGARTHIETVVHHDPHIFDQEFKKQIALLILNPIKRFAQALGAENGQRRFMIIIDGLDECTGAEAQVGIIRAISDALQTGNPELAQTLPRFLICSRPEEAITRAFRSSHLRNMYTSVNLSSDTNARADIEIFLKGRLAEIKATHDRKDLIPASWPSDDDLLTLTYNSSEHFIYAETVVRLLLDDVRPVSALEAIVGLRALPQRVRESFAELDELYRHILLRALEKSSLNTIRHVLGFAMMHPPNPSSLDDTATFLGLEDGELDSLLRLIPSLVYLGIRRDLVFYHQSFSDFLRDKNRAEQFYIDNNATCAYVWARCVDIAARNENPGRVSREFVQDCAFRCHYRSDDLLAGEEFYSLLGITQRRDFCTYFSIDAETVRASWASCCFGYWLELSRSEKASGQLIQEATAVMIDIMKVLSLAAAPTLPLLMCQKPRSSFFDIYQGNYDRDYFELFLCYVNGSVAHRRTDRSQTYFPDLKRLLEEEEMGEFCLSGQRFADASLFWMTHLTKEADFFLSKSKQVIQNQRGLVLNESLRRQQAPFRWRKSTQTIRPYQTKGRLYFLRNRQEFVVQIPEGGNYWDYYSLVQGYTNRELFFGSRSNLVLQKKVSFTREPCCPTTSRFGDRKATMWNGMRTTVRGYRRVSRPCGGELYYIRLANFKGRLFPKDKLYNNKDTLAMKKDHDRREQFRFVLSRIPAMLAEASKSDAVAALRSKAFPPLARCFPKLVQRAQKAMEEYAARHGYVSPYVNPGNKYTAVPPSRDLAVPSAVPLEEMVAVHPPHVTSIFTCGKKRSRRSPPIHAHRPNVDICDEPGCESIIREMDRSLDCSSPDCNRKYHLHCQGMAQAPNSEWFCDEECERDAAVRKRIRYES